MTKAKSQPVDPCPTQPASSPTSRSGFDEASIYRAILRFFFVISSIGMVIGIVASFYGPQKGFFEVFLTFLLVTIGLAIATRRPSR